MLGTANKLKTARQIALTGAVSGSANFDGSGNVSISTSLQSQALTNQDLNNYKTEGFYYAAGGNTCANKPSGVNNFGLIIKRTAEGNYEQIMDVNDVRYTRFWNGTTWSSWVKVITNGDFAVIQGNFDGTTTISMPAGFNAKNCIILACMFNNPLYENWGFGSTFDSSNAATGCYPVKVYMRDSSIVLTGKNIGIINGQTPTIGDMPTLNYKIILMKITNPEVTILGDANCDGVVNSADATLIQNYIQGKSALTLQGFVNADVTKDGDVKASDYAKLQDYLDGDISSLE